MVSDTPAPTASNETLFVEQAYYMIIRLDETGTPELDTGKFSHWEAMGLLQACLDALYDYTPEIRVFEDGELATPYNEADDDESDGGVDV